MCIKAEECGCLMLQLVPFWFHLILHYTWSSLSEVSIFSFLIVLSNIFFATIEALPHNFYVLFSKFCPPSPPCPYIITWKKTPTFNFCTEVLFILKTVMSLSPGLVSDRLMVNQISQPWGSPGMKGVFFVCERHQC